VVSHESREYCLRKFDPGGEARQVAALLASPDRPADLARVGVPTLVVQERVTPEPGQWRPGHRRTGCGTYSSTAWAATLPARSGAVTESISTHIVSAERAHRSAWSHQAGYCRRALAVSWRAQCRKVGVRL
jgi:hypothetical protein